MGKVVRCEVEREGGGEKEKKCRTRFVDGVDLDRKKALLNSSNATSTVLSTFILHSLQYLIVMTIFCEVI